jgi:hypothetical protein
MENKTKEIRLSPDEFIKLWNELSINEMAFYCGKTRQTIRNWARKLGLPPRQKSLVVLNKE